MIKVKGKGTSIRRLGVEAKDYDEAIKKYSEGNYQELEYELEEIETENIVAVYD